MAIDHIATPAVPPATIMALRLRSDGDWPTGVNIFFVTSYAAKYLSMLCQTRNVLEMTTKLTLHYQGRPVRQLL